MLVGDAIAVDAIDMSLAGVAVACHGRVLRSLDALGKHVFYRFDHDVVLHVHFGARGTFRRSDPATTPRPGTVLRFRGASEVWDLLRPRRCEAVTPAREAALRADVGPDPLVDASAEDAEPRVRAFAGPIAAALLDQRVVSGVGTDVAAEALHAARVHPLAPARGLDHAHFERLWSELVHRMERAERDERVLEDPARRGGGPRGPHAVYRRKRCRLCGRPVLRARVRRRTAYYCPSCQRPPIGPE
jgi:formamidopyrimidine-DNA glycosylase